jgi:hypothetical protein
MTYLVPSPPASWMMRAGEVPLGANGAKVALALALALFGVGERPPVQIFLVHHFFKLIHAVAIGVDGQQGERLVRQVLDERPLVGP